MQRRLQQLGFGKIIVLAADYHPGSLRTVSLNSLSGVAGESADEVTLEFAGPGTRQAMLAQAEVLRDHLYQHRNASDSDGGSVPPLFVFYYSGHGTIQTSGQKQVHVLPLSDNLSGERTGDLIRHLTDLVGADSQARGEAGNGFVFGGTGLLPGGYGTESGWRENRLNGSGPARCQYYGCDPCGSAGAFLIGGVIGRRISP